MVCPKCGAENPEYAVYCGSCAALIREGPATSSNDQQRKPPVEGTTWSSAGYSDAVRKSMRSVALVVGVLSAGLFLMAMVELIDSGLDEAFANVSLSVFLAFCAAWMYWMSGNDEALAFTRPRGWIGNVIAEVSGLDLTQTTLLAFVVAMTGVLAPLLFNLHPIYISYLVAGGMFALIVSVQVVTFKVTLEDAGICIGGKRSIRLFIPLDRMSSITLKKNTLTVSLKKAPPLGLRTHRYLIWGEVDAMRTELNRVAPSGVPTPALIRQQQDCTGQERPAVMFVGTGRSDLTVAGTLLIVAGIFALLTVGILFAWDIDTSTSGGSLLFCCGCLEALFGAVAILGGVQTIRRVKYGLSMTAAVLAIVSIGLGVSVVLGIIALVMIHRSRGDFRN